MEIAQKETNTKTPLVEINNLNVEFHSSKGIVKAVEDVSFTLHSSETLAILGESGSGKSTAALALMGLLPKPAGRIVNGEIKLEGIDITNMKESERRKLYGSKLSIIFQDPLSALNPVYTIGYQIGETLRRHQGLSKKQANEKAVELIEQVRIPDARNRLKDYPHQFSGGMQQRVMIAMALALNPKVLIADEPTTALDVTVQAQIMHLLKELQKTNKMGLILISHDLGVVAENADRVAVMYAGHIVETGKVREVFQNPLHPYTLGLMNSIPKITKNDKRLTPIQGAPPDLKSLPKGCAFHPRCPFAQDICKSKAPMLKEVEPGRKSACHFSKEDLTEWNNK
ncbi:ABC transporter ATP-binding protein [Gracilibacillus dipsosauri]|uniref:ABC transporter ATP-binding protein n=1 Tax=Gracilibacillus dipsosauri TaxID=178340 RepID=UPI0024096AAA